MAQRRLARPVTSLTVPGEAEPSSRAPVALRDTCVLSAAAEWPVDSPRACFRPPIY